MTHDFKTANPGVRLDAAFVVEREHAGPQATSESTSTRPVRTLIAVAKNRIAYLARSGTPVRPCNRSREVHSKSGPSSSSRVNSLPHTGRSLASVSHQRFNYNELARRALNRHGFSMVFRRALGMWLAFVAAANGATTLSYRSQLDGRPGSTLSATLQSIVFATGVAVINGVDT
jgi:hypothetical protein